jgi:hypothetical protein
MRFFIAFIAALFVISSSAYQISVGTYVVNANRTVTVPIALDSAAGLSYAGASLTYDPQILVVTKVEAGTLKTIMPEDFISSSTNGLVNVAIFGSTATNIVNGAGTIANVTFAIRAGTEGSYSDIIVSNIDIGEYTGVKDVTVGNPVKTVNGMVRVMRTDAAVQRLEGGQTVVADTTLDSVKLETGDAIQASDAQTPITVAGAVTGLDTIPVEAPVNGWAGGRYALLKTPTAGLSFALHGIEDAVEVGPRWGDAACRQRQGALCGKAVRPARRLRSGGRGVGVGDDVFGAGVRKRDADAGRFVLNCHMRLLG